MNAPPRPSAGHRRDVDPHSPGPTGGGSGDDPAAVARSELGALVPTELAERRRAMVALLRALLAEGS